MSMQNYAVTGYGIVLNGMVDDDTLMGMADAGRIEAVYDFTGEAFPLNDNGVEIWCKGEYFDDETIYYVEASRYPSLFKAAYRDMDELVEDVKSLYLGVEGLPKIDDYRARLRSFSGTYYG